MRGDGSIAQKHLVTGAESLSGRPPEILEIMRRRSRLPWTPARMRITGRAWRETAQFHARYLPFEAPFR